MAADEEGEGDAEEDDDDEDEDGGKAKEDHQQAYVRTVAALREAHPNHAVTAE